MEKFSIEMCGRPSAVTVAAIIYSVFSCTFLGVVCLFNDSTNSINKTDKNSAECGASASSTIPNCSRHRKQKFYIKKKHHSLSTGHNCTKSSPSTANRYILALAHSKSQSGMLNSYANDTKVYAEKWLGIVNIK